MAEFTEALFIEMQKVKKMRKWLLKNKNKTRMSTLTPQEVALFYFAFFYCLLHETVFCLYQ